MGTTDKAHPKIAVVILNWNGLADTIECLESLKQQTYPNQEAVVVDNGSDGNDAEVLRHNYGGQVNVVASQTNQGFAEGCNIGMRYAFEHLVPDYIFLLNNDTVVEPEVLTELVEMAEADTKIGVVGPSVYRYDNSRKLQFERRYAGITSPLEDYALSGCALLVKQNVLRDIELPDAAYFCNYEDADLLARARKMGYKCYYIPTRSKVLHKISASYRGSGGMQLYYKTRNRFLYVRRHGFPFSVAHMLKYTAKDLTCIVLSRASLAGFVKGFCDGLRLMVRNPPSPPPFHPENRRISVTVLTENEERNIRSCLESVKWADETIVVDSGSEDGTLEIAKQYTDKVYVRQWTGYAEQRNFAASKARNDWIMSTDADELVTPALRDEIQTLINNKELDRYCAYEVPFHEFMWGKIMKRGTWGIRHIRLYNKQSAKFEGDIHETIDIERNKVGRLKNAVIHYSHLTFSDTMEKFNRYTEIEAQELVKRMGNTSTPWLFLRMTVEANKHFWGKYLFRGGFLEGWHGLIAAYLRAHYSFLVHIKAYGLRFGKPH